MSTRISVSGSASRLTSQSVSASSLPSTSAQSREARNRWASGYASSAPAQSGSDSATTPLPAVVLSTTAPRRATSTRTASDAATAPPPTITTGRWAAAKATAARATAAGSCRGRAGGSGIVQCSSTVCSSTSIGISM